MDLGATLYCLLVGHSPFPSGDVADVLNRVRRGIFPAPRRLRRSIDPKLEAICLKALAREPEQRHASPLALAGEIEVWLAEVSYRSEQERALHEVKRSLVRLNIERAQNLFSRDMPGEGMLWLARALENIPPDSPGIERAVRTSLGGWHARAKLVERTLSHGVSVLWRGIQPRRADAGDRRVRIRRCGCGTWPRGDCSHRRFATRRRSGRSLSARTEDSWPRRAMMGR